MSEQPAPQQTPMRFQTYLPDNMPSYRCSRCGTDVATKDAILTKTFQGMEGRGYFMNPTGVFNIKLGETVMRTLITGQHGVADAHCVKCNTVLGWKYVKIYDPAQSYKEGNYVLEKNRVTKNNGWM